MTFLRKGKKTKAYYDLNDLGDNDEEFHEFLQYTESNQFPGDLAISEITKKSLRVGKHFNLEIHHGNPTELKVDTMVCIVGKEFDLRLNERSDKLLKKAGSSLQIVCDSRGDIQKGKVQETDGFDLPCKKLLHCYLPPYDDILDAYDDIRDLVTDCVEYASTRHQHKSISFPVLGTDGLNYPPEKVIEWIVEALANLSRSNKLPHIETVYIVVDEKESGCSEIKSGLDRYMNNWRYQYVTQNHALIHNKINLDIVCRCIGTSKEEVIVNSTGTKINLSHSTSKVLSEKAGPELKAACAKLIPLGRGLVKETEGFNIETCKMILHCNSKFSKDDNDKGLFIVMMTALEKCGRAGYKTIAFPAIGMGSKGYSSSVIANHFINAVTEFCTSHPKSSITNVVLYLHPEIAKDQMKDFQIVMKLLDCDSLPDGLLISQRTELLVRTGSVVDLEADVMVNRVTEDMQLGSDRNSRALDYAAGKELQESCGLAGKIRENQIIQTDGFNLACESLYHVTLPEWNEDSLKALSATIEECISEANTARSKSIAFPALGRDSLNYPADRVVWCMIMTIVEFFRVHPDPFTCSVEKVYILCDVRDEEIKEEFSRIMKFFRPAQPMTNNRLHEVTLTRCENITLEFPKMWDNPSGYYEEFVVPPHSKECRMVEDSFLQTLRSPDAQIIEVKRIQNATRYQMYELLRMEVARKLIKQPPTLLERYPMWHGTTEERVQLITKDKFDRGKAGTNAGRKLGAGCYFSTSSEIAAQNKYSPPNKDGERFMILARVVTGEYCLGDRRYTSPPTIKNENQNEIQYDSVVDRLIDPRIFCVFEDAKAYPDYVIKYKL